MRTLQPANRVRVGTLAIAIVVLVVAVGQSFGSLPVLFATASYYAQFTDSGWRQQRRQGAHRRPGCRHRAGHVDRRRSHPDEIHHRHAHHRYREPGRDPHRYAAGQEGARNRAARRQADAPERCAAARAEHHPVSGVRRVLRCHQGRRRVEHRHRQRVAECVVTHHQSDLPAPELGPRRGGEVLRHHRQTRRRAQTPAGRGQKSSGRAR